MVKDIDNELDEKQQSESERKWQPTYTNGKIIEQLQPFVEGKRKIKDIDDTTNKEIKEQKYDNVVTSNSRNTNQKNDAPLMKQSLNMEAKVVLFGWIFNNYLKPVDISLEVKNKTTAANVVENARKAIENRNVKGVVCADIYNEERPKNTKQIEKQLLPKLNNQINGYKRWSNDRRFGHYQPRRINQYMNSSQKRHENQNIYINRSNNNNNNNIRNEDDEMTDQRSN
ncbi:FHA domain protein [Reticulomyxa filosa]|uniref:FHA domain protein n=1 Tax=Reticulomyxa filosa TaxID=46433 RepID=X6MNM8_RETFI|nr:FHA domain protein [Reticulomyxa filosa]|eukprot:ETO15271.1 FHA domain protein [Reticulomyxa filosa]